MDLHHLDDLQSLQSFDETQWTNRVSPQHADPDSGGECGICKCPILLDTDKTACKNEVCVQGDPCSNLICKMCVDSCRGYCSLGCFLNVQKTTGVNARDRVIAFNLDKLKVETPLKFAEVMEYAREVNECTQKERHDIAPRLLARMVKDFPEVFESL